MTRWEAQQVVHICLSLDSSNKSRFPRLVCGRFGDLGPRSALPLRALQLWAADQLLGGTQEGEPQIALRAGRGVSAGPLAPSGAQWAGRRR